MTRQAAIDFVLRGIATPDDVPAEPIFTWQRVSGCLVEISGAARGASLTLAGLLIADSQRAQESVIWIGDPDSLFYPPDYQQLGVDLNALVVIRLSRLLERLRVAEKLLRSGAAGLLLLDLGRCCEGLPVRAALQGRLLKQAQQHHAAMVFLSHKEADAPSLGSMISLRVHGERQKNIQGDIQITLQAVKDKEHGPGWSNLYAAQTPDGLR